MGDVRISIIGGKGSGVNTLLGRILFETKSVKDEVRVAVEESIKEKGGTALDPAVLAAMEFVKDLSGKQRVAEPVKFQTFRRAYTLWRQRDEEEEMLNLEWGQANASLIVVDAHRGIVPDMINQLLNAMQPGISRIIVCVNKMDRVEYNQAIFLEMKELVLGLADELEIEEDLLTFVPTSARMGDLVMKPSNNMKWFDGPSLLEIFEELESEPHALRTCFEFKVDARVGYPVVKSPMHQGVVGRIQSGVVYIGDELRIEGKGVYTVLQIQQFFKQLDFATEGDHIVIILSGPHAVSNGDILAADCD